MEQSIKPNITVCKQSFLYDINILKNFSTITQHCTLLIHQNICMVIVFCSTLNGIIVSGMYTFFVVFLPAAKDKGEKKLFGFSFTPLMREDGTTLGDECHELYVYKVRKHTHTHSLGHFTLYINS